jgi:hypothetical protein
MAKINMPLMSLSASGTFASVFTFSTKKGYTTCRHQKKQVDYTNPARSYCRNCFTSAANWWMILSPSEKALFENYSREAK